MRPTLFALGCLASLLLPERVMGINQTLDDTHPSVKYSAYKPENHPMRCSSGGCNISLTSNTPQPDYTHFINGTVTSVAGTVTIPFTGTSLWVFFGTLHKFGCAFQIDGHDAGTFQQNATGTARGNILGFSNTSLANRSHELSIVSEQGAMLDFDGLTYSSDVEKSSSLSSAHLSGRKDAAIIGGVAGGLLLALIIVFIGFLIRRRREREWMNLAVDHPFPMEIEEKPPLPIEPVVDPPAAVRLSMASRGEPIPNASHASGGDEMGSRFADHFRRLEARFRRMEAAVLRRSVHSAGRSVRSWYSPRSPPPAYSDGNSVSES